MIVPKVLDHYKAVLFGVPHVSSNSPVSELRSSKNCISGSLTLAEAVHGGWRSIRNTLVELRWITISMNYSRAMNQWVPWTRFVNISLLYPCHPCSGKKNPIETMHFKRAGFQTPCQVKMSMAHEIPEPSHQHSSAFIGYKYPPIRSNKCSNFLGLADLLSLFIFICCNASDIVSVTARAHVHVPDSTWPKRRLPVVLAPWRKGPKVCPENHLTMSKKRNKRNHIWMILNDLSHCWNRFWIFWLWCQFHPVSLQAQTVGLLGLKRTAAELSRPGHLTTVRKLAHANGPQDQAEAKSCAKRSYKAQPKI